MKPIIIPIQQRTQEWYRWRLLGLSDTPLKGITSSLAPPIDGTSTWCTAVELWQLLTQRRTEAPPHPAMLMGQKMEPVARERYIASFGLRADPVCLEHPVHRWMRASTDGHDLDVHITQEFKWSNYTDYSTAAAGQVPAKYRAQCAHLRVCSCAYAVHFYALPANPEWGEPALVIYEPDDEYEEALIEKELRFLDYWEKDECPPLSDHDVLIRDDLAFLQAARIYGQLDIFVKALTKYQEEAKARLTAMTTHNREECDYGRATLVKPENGAVDWKRYAASLPGFDELKAESFRKKPQSPYYLITNRVEADDETRNAINDLVASIAAPTQYELKDQEAA